MLAHLIKRAAANDSLKPLAKRFLVEAVGGAGLGLPADNNSHAAMAPPPSHREIGPAAPKTI